MYCRRKRKETKYAFIMYLIIPVFVGIEAFLSSNQNVMIIVNIVFSLILSLFCIFFVFKQEKSLELLGLNKNIKHLIMSSIIFIITIIVRAIITDYSIVELVIYALYNFFIIALYEELLFRGFIQSYLFGLNAPRFSIYILGGFLFAFIHIFSQMIILRDVRYVFTLNALEVFISTFFCHIVLAIITKKSKDIYIPTALHYLWNYLITTL